MKYNLFLDDIRMPVDAGYYMPTNVNRLYLSQTWMIVRNYEDFVAVIKHNGIPIRISFDHDLADEHYAFRGDYEGLKEKTGYHCLLWLIDHIIDNKLEVPEILVHSQNPVGKENIQQLYNNFIKHRKLWEISNESDTPTDK